MWRILAVLFVVVPLIETFVLIEVGRVIGPLPTVLLLLLDGVLGAWLARREGTAIVRRLFADLEKGLPPAIHLVEGALVLAGGILLLTPGFLTDVVGYVLLFPPTRKLVAPVALKWLADRFQITSAFQQSAPREERVEREPARATAAKGHFDHPVK